MKKHRILCFVHLDSTSEMKLVSTSSKQHEIMPAIINSCTYIDLKKMLWNSLLFLQDFSKPMAPDIPRQSPIQDGPDPP